MTEEAQHRHERIDRALIMLRRFFDTPRALGDDDPRVELSTLLVLDAIIGHEPATVRDVADRLDVAHSTASRLITRAERIGMVRRHPSATDKRKALIKPTPAGRTLHERAGGYRIARLNAITKNWPPDDIETFARLLEDFAANVDTPGA